MPNKIDSNVTGLRYAEEASLKTLSGSPVWYELEPNSYSDFGGEIKLVARDPINPSRQRKKGVTVDLDAKGGFNQDLTFNNTTRLLQGFFFADIREKKTTAPMNDTAVEITSVTSGSKTYAAASGMSGFLARQLVLASGFAASENNGLKTLASASTATDVVTVESLTDDNSPSGNAKIQTVGYIFASATVDIELSGDLVQLTRASGAFDFTTLGLIAGEWVFLGGDSAGLRFDDNYGFARIGVIGTDYLEFDKVSWTPAAEVGTGKTVQMFFGSVLKNESNPALIKRRTYQLERTLGQDDDGTMSEYLVGAVPNELTINHPMADKVTVDLNFIAVDNEQRDGATGVKSGTRPSIVSADAYNTANDFSRLKISVVDEANSNPSPLFAFGTEVSISINNNVSPNKALTVLGAFDTSAGVFEVGGKGTFYFGDVAAVQAVRNNEDVSLDICLVKANSGLLFDLPLIALGDGRLAVEKNQAITIPIETNAAESKFNHTLLFVSFGYLPDLAG